MHSRKLGKSSLFYRTILRSASNITAEDALEIVKDENLLIPLVLMQVPLFYELLGKSYNLLPEIAGFLLEEDLKVYTWLLNGNSNPPRIENFIQRGIQRLKVHQKNHVVLRTLAEKEAPQRHAFFDLGALFGLTMVSASLLGYRISSGCELDNKMFKRARRIKNLARENNGIELQYYEEDFNALDLEQGLYTLIVVNNVLEHTPDLEKTIMQMGRIMADDGVISILAIRRTCGPSLPSLTIDCPF